MPLYPFRRAPRPDEAAESEARLQKMAKGLDLSGDPGRPMRLGILFLVLGLGGFLVWAALAPLDEGVPAPGAIVIESQRKPVQHLTGGIVRTVHVAEAQRVAAGEVLLELDDTRLRAEFEKAKADYVGALARIARLQAEQTGATAVTFPPELLGRVSTDVQAQRNIRAQEQFLRVGVSRFRPSCARSTKRLPRRPPSAPVCRRVFPASVRSNDCWPNSSLAAATWLRKAISRETACSKRSAKPRISPHRSPTSKRPSRPTIVT